MYETVSFKKALEKARQKPVHNPSWLYHLAVPTAPFIGLAIAAALGRGKLDQFWGALFFLTMAVWAISDSHVFGLAPDLGAGLDASEETVDALQSKIGDLETEVRQLRAEVAEVRYST